MTDMYSTPELPRTLGARWYVKRYGGDDQIREARTTIEGRTYVVCHTYGSYFYTVNSQPAGSHYAGPLFGSVPIEGRDGRRFTPYGGKFRTYYSGRDVARDIYRTVVARREQAASA